MIGKLRSIIKPVIRFESFSKKQMQLLPVFVLSALGSIPEDFDFEFDPVAEPTDKERADLAKCGTDNVVAAYNAGLISQRTALQELKQQSERTGVWTNIKDEDIERASDTVETPGEMGGMFGGEEPLGPQAPASVRQVKNADTAFMGEADDFNSHHNPESGRFCEADGVGSGGGAGKNDLPKAGKRGKVKPSGENTFLVRGFCNKERHQYHVNKHLAEFSGLSEEQYVSEGIRLLEQKVELGGIRGYMEPDGTIVRYDPRKQWYACGKPKDGMWSFYTMPVKDFEDKRKQVLKYGGKT